MPFVFLQLLLFPSYFVIKVLYNVVQMYIKYFNKPNIIVEKEI